MKISEIPYKELVSDYHRIAELEDEYFSLCKKYSPDTTYEEDDALRKITFEIGSRAVSGKDSTDLNNLKSKLYSEDRRMVRGAKKIAKLIKKIQGKINRIRDNSARGRQ